MSRKVLPLKGYKSLKALNAFHTLLLGLKMLPANLGVPYVDFFEGFKAKTDAEKETLLREAAVFVQLSEDEMDALIAYVTDPNGVPYGEANVRQLGPADLHEIIVAVCMEIGRIRIDLISEDEKKNYRPTA